MLSKYQEKKNNDQPFAAVFCHISNSEIAKITQNVVQWVHFFFYIIPIPLIDQNHETEQISIVLTFLPRDPIYHLCF